MTVLNPRRLLCVVFLLLTAALCFPQSLVHGSLLRIKVHGKSLEGNLDGDSPDRQVTIYLPPSYETQRARRYPVLYLLHGFTDSDNNWFGDHHHFVYAPDAIDKAYAAGVREMIIVMPNAYTLLQGSAYSNSATVGNWEEFICKELVAYIDSHYRTIPDRMSRGLAGHSMGGYGTIRLGMKYSDVFSSIYAMSACCLAPTLARPDPAAEAKVEAVHNLEDFAQADLRTRAVFALAAAWSPDPKNPPFFLDLPYKNGEAQPAIAAEWAANSPLAMIHQYIPNLRRLHAIMFDVGSNDRLVGSSTDVQLDSLLTLYGIPHTYETYDGDHESGIALRLEKSVLPFFSTNLTFPAARH